MFADEQELEQELSRPGPELVTEASTWRDDLVVLGAGGKTGSGIAHMARRALDETGRSDVRVHAVSRWSDAEARRRLDKTGVETVVADLSDPANLDALPDAAQVVFLVGAKFGTSSHPDEAWMTNTVLPAYVTRRYSASRISALSTGNVYPLTSPMDGGPTEDDDLGPVGDYAITCLGRERVFSHAARTRGTPVAIIRLNYACEPRYGVVADIARKILAHQPVDVSAGSVNVVWQRYANEVVLRCLGHAAAPPFLLNLTGPETASVRRIAAQLGERLGVEPTYVGEVAGTALLSNAAKCHGLFGYPDVPLARIIDAQVDWLARGGITWDKPTKFERRDGQF